MKLNKIIGIFLIFALLVNYGFSVDVNIEDLEVDNTNYVVERTFFQSLLSLPFSAYTDGSIISEPDKHKQVKLHDKITSLYYPSLHKDVVMKYEFLKQYEECTSETQYQGPVPEGYDIEKFRCTGYTDKVESLGSEKVYVEDNGYSKNGDSKLDISNYIDDGATLVKIDYHYVREKAKESTSFTKEEEELYEKLNDEDKVTHEDIDEDDNNYQDTEPETKYLESYFCDGNNLMQKTLENGESSKRIFKECDNCVELDDGAQCVTKRQKTNQTNKVNKSGEPQEMNVYENDEFKFDMPFFALIGSLGLGGFYLYNRRKKGGRKRK